MLLLQFLDSATYISNYRTRGQVLEKPADIWPSLLWNLAELWSNLIVHIVNMFSFQVKVPVFSDISYWHVEHKSERRLFIRHNNRYNTNMIFKTRFFHGWHDGGLSIILNSIYSHNVITLTVPPQKNQWYSHNFPSFFFYYCILQNQQRMKTAVLRRAKLK